MLTHKILFVLVLSCFLLQSGCSKSTRLVGADGKEFDSYFAQDTKPLVETNSKISSTDIDIETDIKSDDALLRSSLARFFLVEHFQMNVVPSMTKALVYHPPAGLLFWNPVSATPSQIASTVNQYSSTLVKNSQKPILFSADYEGGGYPLNLKGLPVPGVQRFKKGFTPLVHPIWLGKTINDFGTEACDAHADIMTDELLSVGINFPLTVVSDLAEGLFSLRGVSRDPKIVSICLNAILDVFTKKEKIIMVTKHFPGLGSVSADTHDQTAISKIRSAKEMEKHLFPFQELINHSKNNQSYVNLVFMVSHALYPYLDPQHITTESKLILNDLLRTKMLYNGLILSDAMWMGNYGHLGSDKLLIVYLKSILSGMDLLMIPGSQFAKSVTFFRHIFDGTLTEKEKVLVEQEIGEDSIEIQRQLKIRLKDVLGKLSAVYKKVGYSLPLEPKQNPNVLTEKEQKRYFEILHQVGLQRK